MNSICIAASDDNARVRGVVGATALVIGLSATGAVFFSTGATAGSEKVNGKPAAQRTVVKNLGVKWKDVKATSEGVQFTSHAYAEGLAIDRQAVVGALQRKYPGLKDEQIKVAGDEIYIANPQMRGMAVKQGGGSPADNIFENLCIHITLNLCRKA